MPKYSRAASWNLCLAFLLDPTLNTSHEPHFQIVLLCGRPCHTWDLGLGTMCEVASPNFHALKGYDRTDWPQVTWDLRLGTLCEVASPKFRALKGYDRTDWPQVTWDPWLGTLCEVASPNFHALKGSDRTDWPQSDLGLRAWDPLNWPLLWRGSLGQMGAFVVYFYVFYCTIGLVRARGGKNLWFHMIRIPFRDFCVGGTGGKGREREGRGRWQKGVREWNVL